MLKKILGSCMGLAKKGYLGFIYFSNSLRHILLLIIRIYWGSLLIMTGLGKVLNATAVSHFFETLGIPLPLASAYLVGIVELLGGISLFFGFLTRIFSFLLTIVFIVAFATAHSEAITNFFTNPSLFISQDPFLYLYASLIILCFGPGLISIDYWMERKVYGKNL